jgi:hypothetical protein
MRKLCVGALVLALAIVACLQAVANKTAAEYTLTESVVYCEGYNMGGLVVTEQTATFPYSYVGAALDVEVDWSDNIIFHQFPAGAKVRTEVILHDLTLGAAVYTLSAHFMIVCMDTGVTVVPESSTADGLWLDGPSDAYSAEVNELGLLLYGYNWDTRGLSPGNYRLIFWIQGEQPDNPLAPVIQFTEVDLKTANAGDTDTSAGAIYGFVGYNFDEDTTWLDITLTEKSSGRGQSGK